MARNFKRNNTRKASSPNKNIDNVNEREDIIPSRNKGKGKKLDNKGRKNDPNHYFKDPVQADEMSRIQMTGFGAINGCVDSHVNATICAMYVNPCPGVTPINYNADYSDGTDPEEFRIKGINRAAQKLWYLLTAKSGRAAGYTKADVALLLLALGALIEVYEFIRRIFGLFYTYNQRNRSVPTLVWQSMNLDPEDLRENAANYLKRMNSLMAVMNQLPMIGNIEWFRKCQEIFQNVFMDADSAMAQLYIMNPSTTWILEEDDGFAGGSYLKTVDVCVRHDQTTDGIVGIDSSNNGLYGSSVHIDSTFLNPAYYNKLSAYIDIFETQINKLLFSSSFAMIYSDLLRAFDNGELTRWTFDYIDENYKIEPIYNESMLWMIHNATIPFGLASVQRADFVNNYDANNGYRENYQYGTPFNDVYQWAKTDIVVYNPRLLTPVTRYGSSAYVATDGNALTDTIVDFANSNPSVEDRVENTRYKIVPYDDTIELALGTHSFAKVLGSTEPNVVASCVAQGWELPDHWIENAFVFRGATDPVIHMYDYMFFTMSNTGLDPSAWMPAFRSGVNNNDDRSKFHMFPGMYSGANTTTGQPRVPNNHIGEINSWARLKNDWFRYINEMIYVDLFDMR